jgi:hypothetical protein
MYGNSHATAAGGIRNGMERMKRDFPAANDRRKLRRFRVSAPLVVLVEDREIPAYTRELSNQGVYFCLAAKDSELIDREFEFMVELPPEITLSTCCRIRCRGRVLRMEKVSLDMTGVAAEILDYPVLRKAIPVV